MDTSGSGSFNDYHAKREKEQMNCKCCTLEVEVRDESALCHYCYVRDCGLNPGKCANATKEEGERK